LARALRLRITFNLSHMTEHILIIDSDLQELRRLREILAREGYNIMTASDDKTAQELCARLPIKLVLADVKLLGFAPHQTPTRQKH
jgi:PleD family two-component response regulator